MTQILVTKPRVLNTADKKALRDAGVVVVEAARPADVRLLQTEGPALSGDDLLYAAVRGANTNDYAKEAFARAILDALNHRRERGK